MAEVERKPIGGAFTGEGRGSGLSFAPRPTTTPSVSNETPAAAPAPAPAPQSTPAPSLAVSEVSREARPARKQRSSTASGRRDPNAVVPINTYVSADLRNRLRIIATSTGLTYEGMLVLVADQYLSEVPSHLPKMLNAAPKPGGMPRRTESARRIVGRHKAGHVIVAMRMSGAQVDFLDGLAQKHGDVSRSLLLEAMFSCLASHASELGRPDGEDSS